MSERFLKWATKRYLETHGYAVTLRPIRLGNFEVDGEVMEPSGVKIAIEFKTKRDDICRGMRQLAEAIAYRYDSAILATTFRRARKVGF